MRQLIIQSIVRFTQSRISRQNIILTVLYGQRSPDSTESETVIRNRLTQAVQTRLIDQKIDVTPLVSINVLAPPNRNP